MLIIKDEIIYSFSAASSKQRCLGKETKGRNKEAWVGKCSLKRRERWVSNIGGCRGKEDEAIKGRGTKNSPEKNGRKEEMLAEGGHEVPGEEVAVPGTRLQIFSHTPHTEKRNTSFRYYR